MQGSNVKGTDLSGSYEIPGGDVIKSNLRHLQAISMPKDLNSKRVNARDGHMRLGYRNGNIGDRGVVVQDAGCDFFSDLLHEHPRRADLDYLSGDFVDGCVTHRVAKVVGLSGRTQTGGDAHVDDEALAQGALCIEDAVLAEEAETAEDQGVAAAAHGGI